MRGSLVRIQEGERYGVDLSAAKMYTKQWRVTNGERPVHALVVELVDTLDLGSSAKALRVRVSPGVLKLEDGRVVNGDRL